VATLDRLGCGDFPVFDGTEHGEQFIHLDLLNINMVQEIMGQGLQVFGRFDQPIEHGVPQRRPLG
jgi:hypothetical protein